MRTMCDVLEEMRQCYKTRNFSYLEGLIEEVQTMGNRMEAGLGSKADILYREERLSELRKQRRKLQAGINKLKQAKNSLKPEEKS